jgi:glycerol-3-phosphate dehydrogenase (NAD(P)+)
MTVFGLAGVGDLFLTSSSVQSRNYRFGLGLAAGESPEALIKNLGTVEGAWTASVAQHLCRKHALRTPIIETVVKILEQKIKPHQALEHLMKREIRGEFD